MRCLPFRQLWALYNDDPADDPAGPGTAPGPHFAVSGLDPLEGDSDGCVGRVRLPSAEGQLREDADDEGFGLPRDLNGDTLIDERHHADDYAILPVLVELEWRSSLGPRRLQMHTMLADLGG
jgi:hypothetical protein